VEGFTSRLAPRVGVGGDGNIGLTVRKSVFPSAYIRMLASKRHERSGTMAGNSLVQGSIREKPGRQTDCPSWLRSFEAVAREWFAKFSPN
jgi:hypothetical protein